MPNLAVPKHQVLDVEKLGTKLGGNLSNRFLDIEKLGAKLGGKSCTKFLGFENIVPNLVLRPFKSIVIDFRKSKTIFQGFKKNLVLLGAKLGTWCILVMS